ncbi:MAG: ATP-binding protein [Lachnospiraceae bacterium]|nr:ATP-binding protein [Lachnospiraceae bacterium]
MKNTTKDYKLLSDLFFRIAPFQILLLMANAANGIVDSLFASNFIGKTAMSAMGYYSPLNHFLFALSIILVSGSQILVGKAMGQNNSNSVQAYYTTDILLSVIISVATSILLIIGVLSDTTAFLVADAVERESFNRYVLGQSIGIPALVLGQQFFSFLSLENQTRKATLASIACIIGNICMNTLFVVILDMGPFGLGLGSSMGLWIFCMTMALHYITGKSKLKFSAQSFNAKNSSEIFRVGYPGALSRFLEMFRCIIVNILIIKYVTSTGLSAFAAVNSALALFWPIPFGMAAALRIMEGISIGEEDRRSVTDAMRVVLTKGFALQCAISLCIILLAEPITRMFYRDVSDPVYNMTLMGFRILPLCLPLSVICLAYSGYAQAMEIKKLAVMIPILDGAVNVIVLSFILIPPFKMTGLYAANVINGILIILLALVYAMIANKVFPRKLEDTLVFPKDFGADKDDVFDISVKGMPDVINVSQQIITFCLDKGIDSRRAYFAGLALEEMAGNVVTHGFGADNKKHSVDLRLIVKEDDVILRIRDDCAAFDPLERAELFDTDDKIKNIGIRLINSISKDVSYQNLLGLNVLTIRI